MVANQLGSTASRRSSSRPERSRSTRRPSRVSSSSSIALGSDRRSITSITTMRPRFGSWFITAWTFSSCGRSSTTTTLASLSAST
jgi:hypothetical protein